MRDSYISEARGGSASLSSEVAIKGETFKLEKKIAAGGQRIARQKGLIAKIERAGRDSRQARELLAVFEQTQALFEQRRLHLLEKRAPRNSNNKRD